MPVTPKTGFCNSSRDKGLQPKSRNFSDPRSKFFDPNPAADQGETEKPTTTTTTTTTTRTTTTTTITTTTTTMPESLNTFLQTHPYKKVDCLKHLCSELKLSGKGVAETLRTRIIDHIGDNADLEAKVRQAASKFKTTATTATTGATETTAKTAAHYPMSPIIQILKGITPRKSRRTRTESIELFTQNGESECEDTEKSLLEKSILEEIDEFHGMYNEVVEDRTGNREKESNAQKHAKTIQDDTLWYDDNTREQLHLNIKKLEYLVEQSIHIVSAKDAQIEAKDAQIAALEGHLTTAVSTSAKLLEKHEEDNKQTQEKIDRLEELITNEIKEKKEERKKVEDHLSCTNNKLQNTLEKLQEAQCKLDSHHKDMKEMLQSVTHKDKNYPQSQPSSSIHTRLQQIADTPTAATPIQPPAPPIAPAAPTTHDRQTPPSGTSETVLIIGDSNTKHFVPKLIHEEKEVVIESRYTLEQAMSDVPHRANPQKVSDIVMLTGINNIKRPNANIPETIGKVDDVCRKYSSKFPNAKIHIGSVAPTNSKHIDFNAQLKNLANSRNAPFIPVDAMLDEYTGQLKQNMVLPNDIHYTKKGVSVLAKEVKRSIYGNYKPRHQLQHTTSAYPYPGNHFPPATTSINNTNLSQASSNPRHEMVNILNMAMSCLSGM